MLLNSRPAQIGSLPATSPPKGSIPLKYLARNSRLTVIKGSDQAAGMRANNGIELTGLPVGPDEWPRGRSGRHQKSSPITGPGDQ